MYIHINDRNCHMTCLEGLNIIDIIFFGHIINDRHVMQTIIDCLFICVYFITLHFV